MIITIDGYAGSGKSTAAVRLAAALGFRLLNTGAMYRATAYELGRRGVDIDANPRDTAAIAWIVADFVFEMTEAAVILNGVDVTPFVYTEAMGRAASRVGTFLEVREKLKAEQRRIADDLDVVCEGRDQGTAVFPHAPVKFFFTASAETRARRRAAQDGVDLAADAGALATLIDQIAARDRQDEIRPIDPLRRADDAEAIDTSHADLDQILNHMMEVVARCRSRR
ncbi:(d)CMP kinase [Fimbriiglobus ruber]|uniref:Cytidylate kinase n=1 Tax=Fimbriiglobus ruber TaxID=1908690 RepID=A0A225E3R1_9BACT|nr:(d)CMP kinase [Fimbriiglobus ruber]OWK43325.1 Cytidylate kinase [Fimbriiglobus ruber]